MIRLDPARRQDAIEAGWLAYAEALPDMREQYLAACEGWDVIAVCSDDEVIGALYSRSGVIHLGIRPEWRSLWASRRVINQMLSYGTKTTLLPTEDDTFIRRVGFEKQGDQYEMRASA